MLEVMGRNWWMLLVRGIAAVLFGIAVLVWPGIALTVLVLLWGAYALVDGVLAISTGIRAAVQRERSMWLFVEGVVDIAAAGVAFFHPALTVVAFVFVTAAWALVSGASMVAASLNRKGERGWGW